MMKYKKLLPVVLSLNLLTVSPSAYAVCDGCVVSAIGALGAAMVLWLERLGIQMTINTEQIVSTMGETAKAQREFETQMEKERIKAEAVRAHAVAKSICAESGSAGATRVSRGGGKAKGALRPGGGAKIEDADIAKAINDPTPPAEIDAARAAKINSKYCDEHDHTAFGGSKACPEVNSEMPGAVKRIDSVLHGAGEEGKEPELTFSQKQQDVARMYTQNTVRRSTAPQPRKGEAESTAGAQYVGLITQYEALLSAASEPQDQMIADSIPNEETKELLEDMMTVPSVAAFFEEFASPQAKEKRMMSAREFEAFEVERRYSNVHYQTDLQEMAGENLMREQIRVASLQNHLLLGIKNEIRKGNIINGNILASLTRQEFEPIINAKHGAVTGRLGGEAGGGN
ncbi:MAG: conjugal transfer protein TraW [Rhodocyclaceae bacterium]|nr:conjugal transfer protein TraW [Rhodocyclaceae bacterium]